MTANEEKNWSNVDGLCFKKGGSVVKNKNRELIDNIDNIPASAATIDIKSEDIN